MIKAPTTDPTFRSCAGAGYLWLLCVLLSVIPAFASQTVADPDLIFCPLQKAWVRKGGETPKPDPLKNVCASDTAKQKFSYESFRRLSISRISPDDGQIENLFFDHSRLGDRAFASLKPVPLSERSGITGGISSESSAAIGRTIVETPIGRSLFSPRLTIIALSRQAYFEYPTVFVSEALRQKSQPRAPPVSV